ncbi:DUF2807 domain-containing protein [Seonamhaeicola marinus]|uniref:DUF2807 domain-containing protein n=2 Tax=Seonamhaeicola marinus TaxID=1912246 RepID=A0A5D0HHX3_9FLAO|nr:DUF2807 domain-containing protein [Seonamhaeicola marinus]
MNRYYFICLFLFIFACDSENAGDCFQKTGSIIKEEVVLEAFNKILVNRDIELVIKQGGTQEVILETGQNLRNDVSVEVVDGQLILTDNNTCNFVRDYGITKVYVTSPNITEIRSSTQYDISSNGVLTYPNLVLLSESFGAPDTFTVGDFKLQINNNFLGITFNNLSSCFVSGETTNVNINFASGNGRFEGENLIVQNATIFHRGSNNMIINPQQSIKGKVVSTGDVILKTTPPIIEVETLYKGRVIFD